MRFAIPTIRITGFLFPALFLASAMAVADVPRETLERLAEIRVETAEIEHLKYIEKLTREDYSLRSKALQKEAAALWEPVRRIPHGEAESTIQGLSRAKLALLEPQWEKEAQDFKKASEERYKQTTFEIEIDARRAVEFQRQRLVLQRQLSSGAIDRDSFSLKDRAALSGIADLRKKYETDDGAWAERFDHRLDLFTKALADNPATVLPQSQVGEGPPDFNRDVQLAAEILIKEEENAFKFDKKQISPDTFRETAVIYSRDRGRLRERYQSVSPKRAEEFQNAYTRMAEPSIHALRVKYYPGKYTPIAPAVKRSPGDGWIDHAPTVAQVFKDIQGNDQIDTTARQAAVFEILRNSIQTWTGVLDIRRMSPRAVVKFQEYSRAFGEKPYDLKFNDGACVGDACTRKQFYDKQYRYSTDPKFTREALALYFPKEFVEAQVAWQIDVQTPKKPVTKPGESWWDSTTFWYFFLGVGGVMLAWMIIKKIQQPQEPDFAPPLSDNYGTAQWAEHQLDLSGTISRGVMFGKSSRPDLPAEAPGAPITSTPESHTLIVAQTGAGKGTRVIVPTLLRYADSMLVIDPKGENAAITARTRRDQLKQEIHIINPWGVMKDHYKKLGFGQATFNPLDVLERNDPNAVAIAQSFAKIICPGATGQEKFWQGSSASILAGVLLWLTDQEGLPRVDDPTQKETKTLSRASDLLTQSRGDFKKMLAPMMASDAFHRGIRKMVSQFWDMADTTYSGIMANAAENITFLSDPQINATTKASSFSMQDLLDRYITIYLVIPHKRIQTHSTWLRLLITSATQALISRNDRLPSPHHRCMFLIDEFGSIGHMEDIPTDIALMRGYGLDYTLVVQGLNQLNKYGEDKDTILSNCRYKWFCYLNDLESAKYLSEILGKSTVRTVGKSKSQGASARGATEGESTTYGETGRPLFDPAELQKLGREIAFLITPSTSPYYLRPVDYWELSKVFAYLKDKYHFYWSPPLSYDDNPLRRPAGGEGAKEKARTQAAPPPSNRMTDKEARQILGVKADAKPEEIRAAYTRLMKGVHPDLGGSNYLAVQINAAKAFLLGE